MGYKLLKSLVGFDDGKRKLGSYFHLGVFRGQSHSLGITIIFQSVYANKLLVLLNHELQSNDTG